MSYYGSGLGQTSQGFSNSQNQSRSQSSTQVIPQEANLYQNLLGLNQANYQNVFNAYNQNRSDLGNVSGSQLQPGSIAQGYQGVLGGVENTLGLGAALGGSNWGVAQPAATAIGQGLQQTQAANTQNAASAGLGNTSWLANQQTQSQQLANQAYAGLGANLAQTAAGYQASEGNAGQQALMQGAQMQNQADISLQGNLAGYSGFSNKFGNITGGFGSSASQGNSAGASGVGGGNASAGFPLTGGSITPFGNAAANSNFPGGGSGGGGVGGGGGGGGFGGFRTNSAGQLVPYGTNGGFMGGGAGQQGAGNKGGGQGTGIPYGQNNYIPGTNFGLPNGGSNYIPGTNFGQRGGYPGVPGTTGGGGSGSDYANLGQGQQTQGGNQVAGNGFQIVRDPQGNLVTVPNGGYQWGQFYPAGEGTPA